MGCEDVYAVCLAAMVLVNLEVGAANLTVFSCVYLNDCVMKEPQRNSKRFENRREETES